MKVAPPVADAQTQNLPSVYLILHDFDYLPRFFSVSD
jgi:hypothetical protein